MTNVPDLTHRHADQLSNHWWWRPGWRVGTRYYAWFITFDRKAALHQLADEYQAKLSSVGGLDLIPSEWRHITMQNVGFVDSVPDNLLSAMLAAARTRLGELEPVTVQFHRPVLRPEAIVLPPSPDAPIQRLRRVVRSAVSDVIGAENVPENITDASAVRTTGDNFQPHTSIAYVNADQPADKARQALDQVHAQPVEHVVSALSLIEMHRDRQMYEWRTVEAVPIGARSSA